MSDEARRASATAAAVRERDRAGGRLAGVRVLVTRPAEVAGPIVELLRAAGAIAIEEPMLVTTPVAYDTRRLAAARWVLLTSAFGAAQAAAHLPADAAIAVVGASTATELARRGRTADFVAAGGTGAALADELPIAAGDRVVLLRSDLAESELPRRLRARGATVDDVVCYRTVPLSEPRPGLRAALAAGGIDAILLASPSAAQGLVNSCGRDLGRAVLVTIGPTTTRAVDALGLTVAAEADAPSAEAMIAALEELCST